MTDIHKNFHSEVIEGFTVRLRFEDEHLSPEDFYDDDECGKQDKQEIYDGEVTWLCAVVEVFKCGVELAYTTLGAITYRWNDLEDFVKDGFQDMASEAIEEAKAKLQELRAA